MKAKRMLSLVMAAVLALCVLAGCRGGRALSQVMAGLLEGQYQNVAVEADPDLEAALRAAVREGGELADILARLQQELGLGGGTLTLRGLSGGRQGEHAVELRFEPGSDPDTAARKAFADWDAALARLPSDGQYAAAIAMVEAEGGYYIAVDVKIVKAGKPDTDDDDEPEEPYTKNGDHYTVNTSDGLVDLFQNEEENKEDFAGKTITLQAGRTYTVNKQLASTFKGILTSDAGNKATIEITGDVSQGLFGEIDGGKVENLQINVTGSISGSASTGASVYAGAVAGENRGIVSGCTVTASGKISASITGTGSGNVSGSASAGGVAGYNFEGTVNVNGDCTVEVSGEISASVTGGGHVDGKAYAGGVAGYNLRGELNGSGTLKESGVIKATVGTNTATIPSENQEDPVSVGSARAGTICGFSTPPAA